MDNGKMPRDSGTTAVGTVRATCSVDATGVALELRGRAEQPGRTVTGLVLRRRGAEAQLEVPVHGSDREFTATVDRDAVSGLVPTGRGTLDVVALVTAPGGREPRAVRLAATCEPHPLMTAPSAVDDERAWWGYATSRGNLSMRVAPLSGNDLSVEPAEVGTGGTGLEVLATAELAEHVQAPRVRLLAQPTSDALDIPTRVVESRIDPFRRVQTVTLEARVPWPEVAAWAGAQAEVDRIRLQMVADADDVTVAKGLRLSPKTPLASLDDPVVELSSGTVVLVTYLTFKAGAVAFTLEKQTRREARAYRWAIRAAPMLRALRPMLAVWLIGELPYKAQDNGARLFEWIRRHHPRRRVYYVIDPASPDLPTVATLGRTVMSGSARHMVLSVLADRLVSTHHVEYILGSSSRAMRSAADGTRVFLTHGTLGVKNMAANYGRDAVGFHTDRFFVSSERERRAAVDDLGYEPYQVEVTGLPRFDRLLTGPDPDPQGLLVIPTWRDWLGPESFGSSEFLARWTAFLTSPALQDAVRRGLRVRFIAHPNMRRYADRFAAPGVEVLRQGEAAVQDLLRSHAALVTDYSSVAFDFSLQERPVFYLQFDRERFVGSRPSHMDLDSDLPGPSFREPESLAEAVAAAFDGGFEADEEFVARAHRLRDFHDTDNCARAYAAIARVRPTSTGPALGWRYTRPGARHLTVIIAQDDATNEDTVHRRLLDQSGTGRRLRVLRGGSPRSLADALRSTQTPYVAVVAGAPDSVGPDFVSTLLSAVSPDGLALAGTDTDAPAVRALVCGRASFVAPADVVRGLIDDDGAAALDDAERWAQILTSGIAVVAAAADSGPAGDVPAPAPAALRAVPLDVVRRLEALRASTRDGWKAVDVILDVLAERLGLSVVGDARGYEDLHGRLRDAATPRFPMQTFNAAAACRLVISYTYPPFVDASGMVAERRQARLARPYDLITQDMTEKLGVDPLVRSEDLAHLGRRMVTTSRYTYGHWPYYRRFLTEALGLVEERTRERGSRRPYDELYSRSMWGPATVLAALLKSRSPGMHWTAEFSDPLTVTPDGTPRLQELDSEDPFVAEIDAAVAAAGGPPRSGPLLFPAIEWMAFALADEIVFTNENQREVMLELFPHPQLTESVRRRSRIERHPVPPAAAYLRAGSSYPLEPDLTHLGYFGRFYAGARGPEVILDAIAALSPQRARRVGSTSSPTSPAP
ncbi:hypothetical protein GCM10025865_21760 [Paraoerskovia sediminicola]|uniref:CDP-glycerol glycerophosphotransferase, TagB/SpsB family n=1 Tax=Paraoerskovia sediminicola TaxID=1138587 RepID=A0ABN6XD61_9CELL|nr:CDP-glycerol glycerophosphotransferase family protein [Paraoerskovia sediminicola]BDZ42877.1 hypothetical protein GCM10025865_21760 [Paraoerskovia sediminicola]